MAHFAEKHFEPFGFSNASHEKLQFTTGWNEEEEEEERSLIVVSRGTGTGL